MAEQHPCPAVQPTPRPAGHLFEEGFSAYPIQDESYLVAACRYVLENPVLAGLCDTVEAWQWSDCAMV